MRRAKQNWSSKSLSSQDWYRICACLGVQLLGKTVKTIKENVKSYLDNLSDFPASQCRAQGTANAVI